MKIRTKVIEMMKTGHDNSVRVELVAFVERGSYDYEELCETMQNGGSKELYVVALTELEARGQ